MILIHGKAGTGKSTLAMLLSQELGLPIGSLAFPLKRRLWQLGNYQGNLFDKAAIGIYGDTYPFGLTLQIEAERAKKLYGKLYYCHLWSVQRDESKSYIVDDIRFDYELDYFQSRFNNCVTVKLKGDFNVNDGRDKNHISERGISDDRFDIVCDDGDLFQLVDQIRNRTYI